MSDINQQLIADLATDPAYQAMCEFIQEQVNALGDKLAAAESPQDAMKCLRTWQVARSIITTLRTAPASIKDTLDLELQRDPLENHHSWMQEEQFFVRRPMVK